MRSIDRTRDRRVDTDKTCQIEWIQSKRWHDRDRSMPRWHRIIKGRPTEQRSSSYFVREVFHLLFGPRVAIDDVTLEVFLVAREFLGQQGDDKTLQINNQFFLSLFRFSPPPLLTRVRQLGPTPLKYAFGVIIWRWSAFIAMAVQRGGSWDARSEVVLCSTYVGNAFNELTRKYRPSISCSYWLSIDV